MTWAHVARKDFEDSVRSRMMWAAVGVFVLLMTIIVLSAASGNMGDADARSVIALFSNVGGQLLVPIIALMVGYMAIVGERRSGSLRVLFGLNHGRRDVFLGKLASRLGVIGVATLVTCVVAAVATLALFSSFPVAAFLGFVVVTVALGAVFTAVAVGVSAATGSRMTAMGGAIGSYVLFAMLWHPLVAGVHYAVTGELAGLEAANWYFLLLRLNPLEAYIEVTSSLADQLIWGLFGWQNVVEDIPASALEHPKSLMLSNRVAGGVPFYLSDWFTLVVMALWVVVPAALGYWTFRRADLN